MRSSAFFTLISMTFLFPPAHAAAVLTPPAVPSNFHVWNTAGAAYVDVVAWDCSGVRYYLDPDHVKYSTIVSILMAAQITGRKVVLRFDGCNSNQQGIIVGAYLQD